ncbi:hypothetical protein SAMN05216386_2530 [Nitrosospira briensis]|uniref:Uncharacterized protein n=1 Tax=Nitrosospira briensis TaxID=35799 RepID=A0A1I5E761_9PROT|nr:hypothetical protein [Nitrosospira briensis]SFO07324.1 hypothetical protein SAMN05216386_2530 [Nitrosospira briensis]
MHKGLSVLLVGIVLVYGNTAVAREGGGGGHHGGHHGMADAGQHEKSGGMASGRMGQQGIENSNAQWSIGATTGQERSDSRNQDHHGHETRGKDRSLEEGKHKGHEFAAKGKSDKSNKGSKGKSGDSK